MGNVRAKEDQLDMVASEFDDRKSAELDKIAARLGTKKGLTAWKKIH